MEPRSRAALLLLGWTASVAAAHAAPPYMPVISGPSFDAKVVSGADVHMEVTGFSDDDGDTHTCSDWEIWLADPSQRVWSSLCATGLEKVHIHLGDGYFDAPQQTELTASTDYRLAVRFIDSAGEASDWAERTFSTASASAVVPLVTEDVTPDDLSWTNREGQSVLLPGGVDPASLRIESPAGDLLFELDGNGGMSNTIVDAPALAEHVPLRLHFDNGGQMGRLTIDASDLRIATSDDSHTLYLPAVDLAGGEDAYYWLSQNGSSYQGEESQLTPDFSRLARASPVPWRALLPGYEVELVATGFQLPVDIAFVPHPGTSSTDPLFYVTELYGAIKVVTRAGTVREYATNLLNFDPTGIFPGSGEQGVTGVVVEPITGDVFAALLYSSDPSQAGAPHYPMVLRLHSEDGGRTAATETTILDLAGETQGQSHQISNLSIGPDGKLYVHMGDGFATDEAQNLDSFRGKILRSNLDGSPAPDNPFFDPDDGIDARDYVYALGFRNPFGGAWRIADGVLYAVENGPSVDRFEQVVPGRNYLWDGSDASMRNFALYNWIPSHAIVNLSFVEPSVFDGSGFPIARQGHAFVTESGPTWARGMQTLGKRIVEFALDANGAVVEGPRALARYDGDGRATAVGLAAGPDGLYFSDLYKDVDYSGPTDRGANVLRIRYVGAVDFAAHPRAGKAPLRVQFVDTSSLVGATAWQWDFGDGQTSSERHPGHKYRAPGDYTVRLRVTAGDETHRLEKSEWVHAGDRNRVAPEIWQMTTKGAGEGRAVVRFDGGGTLTGYGFRRDDTDLWTISGGWANSGEAQVVGSGIVEQGSSVRAVEFTGSIRKAQRLDFMVTDGDGSSRWQGVALRPSADPIGRWSGASNGECASAGTLVIRAAGTGPGVFDLEGLGGSGQILISSGRILGRFDPDGCGSFAVSGGIDGQARRLRFEGRGPTGQRIEVRAERGDAAPGAFTRPGQPPG